MSGRRKFTLDKVGGKWMGVCSGIANYLGIDATFVRIAAVVLTVIGGFPWTVIAYLAVGFIAKPKRIGLDDVESIGGRRLSTYDLRANMRDIDRRMAEVESYVTQSNTRLAREIEELR
ncbi:MAG: PspC domain-containing protein [Pseudomonadota bacterium]|nr:PspC domain-containing protein [Pseudomonadota bacterium]